MKGVERTADAGFAGENGPVVGASGADTEFEARFGELYLRAKRPALRILAGSADAEDVAAEALARLYVRRARLFDEADVGAWVVRVATNLAIDYWRCQQRRGLTRPAETTDPGEVSDRRLVVAQAVARLPRRQRQVVALRYFADMPDGEIANTLDMNIATVRTHLQRARQALAGSLGAEGGFDELV